MIENQPAQTSGLFNHPSHAIHKRHVLTLKERVAVLKYLDSHPKATTTEVCHLFASNPRTIRRIQDKRETLLNLPDGDKRLSRTRFTRGTCLPVEACVLKWMDLAHLSKCNITNLTLQNRAKFFFALVKAYLPNLPFLAASNGWINRFKVRNAINLKDLIRESDTYFSQELAPVREKMQSTLGLYAAKDIFSISTSMLYYSFIPTPNFPFPHGSGVNTPPKERLTLILCSNSDASEKVAASILRSSDDSSFGEASIQQLDSQTGRLDPKSLSSWLANFREYVGKERRVALVVDDIFSNYFISEKVSTLYPNIEFIFLPQRHASHLQAFNLGITNHFKAHYRAGLLHEVLRASPCPSEEDFSSFCPTNQVVFQLIHDAWTKVPASVHQLAWNLTGLIPNFEPTAVPEEVELLDPFRALAQLNPSVYSLIGGYELVDQIHMESDGSFPTEAELLIVEEAVSWYLDHRDDHDTKKSPPAHSAVDDPADAFTSFVPQPNSLEISELAFAGMGLDHFNFFQGLESTCLEDSKSQDISPLVACAPSISSASAQCFDPVHDFFPGLGDFGAVPMAPTVPRTDQIQNVDMLLQLLRNHLNSGFGAPSDVTSALDYVSQFVHQFDPHS